LANESQSAEALWILEKSSVAKLALTVGLFEKIKNVVTHFTRMKAMYGFHTLANQSSYFREQGRDL